MRPESVCSSGKLRVSEITLTNVRTTMPSKKLLILHVYYALLVYKILIETYQ